jgi:hypothetical protein
MIPLSVEAPILALEAIHSKKAIFRKQLVRIFLGITDKGFTWSFASKEIWHE